MKITDETVLKNLEKELIDSVVSDLNWEAIEKVFKEEHNLVLQDDVEYKYGDLVVHNNQLAYKFDFDVKVMLSVILYRDGNYLLIKTPVNNQDDGEPLMVESGTGRTDQITAQAGHECDMDELAAAPKERNDTDAPDQRLLSPDPEPEAAETPEDNSEAQEPAPEKTEQVDQKMDPKSNVGANAEPGAQKDGTGTDISNQITTEIEIDHMVDKVIVEEALAELTQVK